MTSRIPIILFCSLLSGSFISAKAQTFKQIDIEIEQDSIDELESHPYTNEDVHGSFTVDGIRTDTVEIHYRGAYNLWQLIRKGSLRNWKVKFEKDQKFENRREWNLNYENYIRQNLAYHIFKQAGVPCVSSENVILSVNGTRQGLYLKYEDPDNKDWLAETFGDDEGDLYKAAFDMPGQEKYFADLTYLGDTDEDYFLHYRKQTNKKGENEFDYGSVRELISFLNFSSDPVFNDSIAEIFAVDEFIKYLVVSNFIANWDGYPFRPKNFFLYNNPADQKWNFIPWDLDGTFQEVGIGRNPIGTTGSVFHYFDGPDPYDHTPTEPLERPLVWRLMKIQKYRDQFIYEYQQAIEGFLTESNLNEIIDSITTGVEANTFGQELDDFLADVNTTRDFIEARLVNVTAELDQYEVENPYMVHVSGVDIPIDSVSIFEGNMLLLTAHLSPEDAEDKRVSWISTDTAVAIVSGAGLVQGISAGYSTIRASSIDGGISDSCIITVQQETVTGTNEREPLDITVFPNPANNFVRIQLRTSMAAGNVQVHMINVLGQRIISRTIHSSSLAENSIELHLEHIPSGQYYILVESELGVSAKKLNVLRIN